MRSVWVSRVQGFPGILRRTGSDGGFSGGVLWRLKVTFVWVARMQGFSNMLRWEASEGVFQAGVF